MSGKTSPLSRLSFHSGQQDMFDSIRDIQESFAFLVQTFPAPLCHLFPCPIWNVDVMPGGTAAI